MEIIMLVSEVSLMIAVLSLLIKTRLGWYSDLGESLANVMTVSLIVSIVSLIIVICGTIFKLVKLL